MHHYLAQIADRVINQPLMILPEKLALIASILEGRINIDASGMFAEDATLKDLVGEEINKPMGSRYVGDFAPIDPNNPRAGRKSYRTTQEGVAIIPVHGSLVNRGGFLDAMSGMTSYEKLKHQLNAAAADKDVASILLDIDSPGGEAIGAFETGDAVRKATLSKPVIASANGLCCSAAYAIASGASRIVASKSSLVGSIGTVMLHLDRSKQLADAGIKPTLFTTGKRKADGNPFFELSDEVKGELRSYVQRVNANFIQAVVDHRGITAEAVLALEAGVFIGAEAIAHGLVDEVGSFETALSDLTNGAHRQLTPRKALPMSDKTYTQAEHDAAIAKARTEGHTEGHTAGLIVGNTQGVKSERERFKAVQSSENYKGRETSANHILHTTDMSADDIGAVLSGLTAAPVDAKKSLPEDRAQNQPNGLVVEGAQSEGGKLPPANDFEKGKAIGASLKK